MKTALILGASGLVGSELLKILLTDERYGKVRTLGRKKLAESNPKLAQFTGDLFQIENERVAFEGVDDLFIAIGTTRAKTPDKSTYEAIDYGIPTAAAQVAKAAGIKNVAVVSSMGANAKSSIFYSSLKGRMEEALQSANFDNLVILRPSLLLGKRNEKRAFEKVSMILMTALDVIIPAPYKAVPAVVIAKAMIHLANQKNTKPIWLNNELFALAKPD